MPNLNQILLQTMPLTANPGMVANFGGSGTDLMVPDPRSFPPVTRDSDGFVVTPTQDIRRLTDVWSWQHSHSEPATVRDIKSRILGMSMDYRMPMSVCDEISLQEVSVTMPDGTAISKLPLDPSFVLRKYRVRGRIDAGKSSLFPLEMVVDGSFLVVFGYRIQASSPVPLTEREINDPDFMPTFTGSSDPIPCNVGEVQPCVLKPVRIVVCFSVTCCLENNNFEPGGVLGANRIFPHAMLMSNLALQNARAVIKVVRPGTSSHTMPDVSADIGPILVTDTNLPPNQTAGPPLPYWDNMFDYYELNPNKNITKPLQMVVGDPASPRSVDRPPASGLVWKLDSSNIGFAPTYVGTNLVKVARQGDFDNMHLAPKMNMPVIPGVTDGVFRSLHHLDNISMAPFCVHDCLHTHVRWGKAPWVAVAGVSLPAYSKGFNNVFQPYCVEGAPQVPHNQSVNWTLLSPAGFTYEAIAHFEVNGGQWQVFFHHGMAYANELWDAGTVRLAANTVEHIATLRGERDFSPLTAGNSFPVFYWRLRFGADVLRNGFGAPLERISANLSACMAL